MKSEFPLIGTPVDSWLDKRRKLDGAEGLWRIHDKLYDFTIWSRVHPGGKFWLDTSRGTDITEAFESHHFSNTAESLLKKYYIRDASAPRNFFTVFRDNGFYKVFKRKVCQQQLLASNAPSYALTFTNDSLAAAVLITSLLAPKFGVTWAILNGVLLGVLSASCHGFLHTKDNWRVNYFNLSLMSSREWRIRHVLGHHQYRNTYSDLEIPIWRPFSEDQKHVTDHLLNLLLFPVVAHTQFLQRCLDVLLSRKLGFHREELVAFSLPLFTFVFSGAHPWDVFVAWNLSLLVGSFVFCLTGSSFLTSETQIKSEKNSEREDEDFGTVQLSHTVHHPMDNESVYSFLNSFRGNVLHYLCPTISCGSLKKLVPVFEETLDEFVVRYSENSKSLADVLPNRMPQGHLFFS